MPFYDLYCKSCDKEYNIRASMEDKTERRIQCPDCSSTEMESVYKSAPFYVKNRAGGNPTCPQSKVCGAGGCRHMG